MRKKRAEASRKAKLAAKAAADWQPSASKPSKLDIVSTPGSDGAQALSQGKPFQRVDSEFWGEEAHKIGGAVADNSYGHAFGEQGFGAKSSEKLLTVRGKDFQREKNKRKRSFNGFSRTGGQINMDTSHSTKFSYSD
jgi:hypothetical protein